MDFDDDILKAFLEPQLRDHGAKEEIDAGLWLVFAVSAHDALENALARSLLAAAPFPHQSGPSEDDQWTVYYVDTANRAAALHWLDDLAAILAGAIRTPTPAQRALINDVAASDKPHRAAQQLAEAHTRGELGAGTIRDPAVVRSLLDRLHQREPLFFAAFLTLLSHHLIDLVVLLRQLIPEDIALKNEIVMGALSRDPFLQSRQNAAAEIRNLLLRFQLINPIDQQKNLTITNPYAVFLEVVGDGEEIRAPIDGTIVTVPRKHYLDALRTTRRNLYRGEAFSTFDTQAPWMTQDIAYAFRFLKQRVDAHRELTPLDTLVMLERAVEA